MTRAPKTRRRVLVAEHSGYCLGVRRAVKKAEAALGAAGGGPVHSCGPLIHNGAVMSEMEGRGLVFARSLDEVPAGSRLIVRAHGEGPEFYSEAGRRGMDLIDATCPFVRRIQRLVSRARSEGFVVVVAGDSGHPEVIGIDGWCGGEAIVVKDAAEAGRVTGERVFAVAQTTMIRDSFQAIAGALRRQGRELCVRDTICDATSRRQESCDRLAGSVDAMLVLGDKKSSNTKKLFEIALMRCRNSYFVENIEDLPLKELRKCNTIGVAAGASTPERMIKEVIANMTSNNESTEKNSMADFMDEIEKSLRLPRTGEIVTGIVILVSNREVILNLGCKKDGVIPRDEIALEQDQTLPDVYKEGDEVQAKVLKTDDGDGNILLSKKKVVVNEHWEDINRAFEEKSILEAKVIKEVNGGVIAVFKEIYGFIPLSQLSDRFVDKADEFIGKVLTVRVTRVDQKRNKIVFSHKAVLAEERQKRLLEIWESLHVGDVIEGSVMRFTDYGAFVDIGGVDGLLHISEISWGKLKHPQEMLKIGQKIPVKILSMIKEKEKISLGYKQNQPEPWSIIDEKYSAGQIIKGKAVQIKDYGVFVELEPGLDGLVHISEIAFKRVSKISDEISVGQEIRAKILEIDKHRRRISLSIKGALDKASADDDVAAAAGEGALFTEVKAGGEAVADEAADDETAAAGEGAVFAEAEAVFAGDVDADDVTADDEAADDADADDEAADDADAEDEAVDDVEAEDEAEADEVADDAAAADEAADDEASGDGTVDDEAADDEAADDEASGDETVDDEAADDDGADGVEADGAEADDAAAADEAADGVEADDETVDDVEAEDEAEADEVADDKAEADDVAADGVEADDVEAAREQ